jgi:hypothetical protein
MEKPQRLHQWAVARKDGLPGETDAFVVADATAVVREDDHMSLSLPAHAEVAYVERGTWGSAVSVAEVECHLNDNDPDVIQVACGIENAEVEVLSGAVVKEDVSEHCLCAAKGSASWVLRVAMSRVVGPQLIGHVVLPALLRPDAESAADSTTTSVDESFRGFITVVYGN